MGTVVGQRQETTSNCGRKLGNIEPAVGGEQCRTSVDFSGPLLGDGVRWDSAFCPPSGASVQSR